MKLRTYSVEIHHGPDCECTEEQLKDFADSLPSEQEVQDAILVIMGTRLEPLDTVTSIQVKRAAETVAT